MPRMTTPVTFRFTSEELADFEAVRVQLGCKSRQSLLMQLVRSVLDSKVVPSQSTLDITSHTARPTQPTQPVSPVAKPTVLTSATQLPGRVASFTRENTTRLVVSPPEVDSLDDLLRSADTK